MYVKRQVLLLMSCWISIYCIAQKKPNIVIILADDMGYTDWTGGGSQYYQTPHLKRLADMGTSFTNAHTVNPLCSPTRASLLTGRYPARFGLTTAAGHLPPVNVKRARRSADAKWKKMIEPVSSRFLPLEEMTIAEELKVYGYKTGFVGKWHLGSTDTYAPEAQGFDVNVAGGRYPGPPSYFSPYRIHNLPDGKDNEYITDRLTDEAIRFIENNKDTSFLLCMWHYAVHGPWQAKRELVQKYSGKKDPSNRQRFSVMGAMIENMDENIGRLLDKLEFLGLMENTIIVFTSDNGGNTYIPANARQTIFVTNNHPLRSGKGSIYEGGLKVPFIACWRGEIPAGRKNDALISSVDLYPTLLGLIGKTGKRPGKNKFDGRDVSQVFLGSEDKYSVPVFSHFPHYVTVTGNTPATMVIKDDYKLIKFYGEGNNKTPLFELYNLKEDISEKKNRANQTPGKVKELDRLIVKHVRETGSFVPIVNPAYDPSVPSPLGTIPKYDKSRFRVQ